MPDHLEISEHTVTHWISESVMYVSGAFPFKVNIVSISKVDGRGHDKSSKQIS